MATTWPQVYFTPRGTLLINSATGSRWGAGDAKGDWDREALADLIDQVLLDGADGSGASFNELERYGLASIRVADPDADAHADFIDQRKSACFWDYAQHDALARDARDMLAFELQEPSPRGPMISCIEPASGVPCGDPRVVEIARTVFSFTDRARFHHQQVGRRVVPSIGARHGLTCHIVRDAQGLQACCTRMEDNGALSECSEMDFASPESLPALLVSVRFEHYQWRYRTGWILQCIYLDLGHAVAAIRLLAAHAAIRLRITFSIPPLKGDFTELVSEPLLLIQFFPKHEARHA